MAREIKFRVWDKEENKMLNPEHFHIEFFDSEEIFVKDAVNCRSKKYIELMQFTGLKDKKGKEIYEGDILECSYEGLRDVGEVVFYQAGFAVKSDIKPRHFDWYVGILPKAKLKILGNIYENKNLIQ